MTRRPLATAAAAAALRVRGADREEPSAGSTEDLAAFVGILIVSAPVHAGSIALDLMIVRAPHRRRKGR